MVLKTLIDPSGRTNTGYYSPVVRVYPNGPGAVVLFNKSAIEQLQLNSKSRVLFTYADDQIYLTKVIEAGKGFRIASETATGRLRFYINRQEYYSLLSFCKRPEGFKLVFTPDEAPVISLPNSIFGDSYRLDFKTV